MPAEIPQEERDPKESTIKKPGKAASQRPKSSNPENINFSLSLFMSQYGIPNYHAKNIKNFFVSMGNTYTPREIEGISFNKNYSSYM